MGNKRCDLGKKEYEQKIPDHPKFECKKCHRLANKKEKVCKPSKI